MFSTVMASESEPAPGFSTHVDRAIYDQVRQDVARAMIVQNARFSRRWDPAGKVRGQTLATSLFDLTTRRWTLYPGNPCQAQPVAMPWPT